MNSILIIAGESSGERYGAGLVRAMLGLDPSARFFGIGGKKMAAQGVDILFRMEDLAVMGLFEVIGHLPRIHRIYRKLVREISGRRPSAAVLIDSPDFNLRLARRLQKKGIPVLYYVSPTVWAWRKGRLKTIRKYVAKMMLIFPFEEQIYKANEIPSVYIGHPILETLKADLNRDEFFARYNLDPDKKLIVLLPGSRRTELKSHLPTLLEAAHLIQKSLPVQFVLALADGLKKNDLARACPDSILGIKILEGDGYSAMASADLVLSACGTATLEAAILGAPMIAFYRVSPLTYHVGRRLVKIKHYSIVNILAGKKVIPELIQMDFTAAHVLHEVQRVLTSAEAQAEMKAEFLKIKDSLGRGHASENAARELEKLLHRRPSSL